MKRTQKPTARRKLPTPAQSMRFVFRKYAKALRSLASK